MRKNSMYRVGHEVLGLFKSRGTKYVTFSIGQKGAEGLLPIADFEEGFIGEPLVGDQFIATVAGKTRGKLLLSGKPILA